MDSTRQSLGGDGDSVRWTWQNSFAKCTRITLGDGNKTLFCHSGWLQGRRPKGIAPLLFSRSTKKKRTVRAALHENTWIGDLNHRTGFTPAHLTEFAALWNLVRQTTLQPQQSDSISWTLTSSVDYTTASAYKAQFHDQAHPVLPAIWKSWAPPKCKFFAWLIL
jgi:hypothetical protein